MTDPLRFPVAVERFTVEHLRDTHALGVGAPRLSWTVQTEREGWRQQGYALELTQGAAEPVVFGPSESPESVLVPWPFAPLSSRDRVSLRVRVWGEDGSVSPWSEKLNAEVGLLEPGDWSARFITPDWDEDTSEAQPTPMLRHTFEIDGEVGREIVWARLYVSALGVFEAYLNGERIGDHVLAPGWTSYPNRLRYETFDVTPMLRPGTNALGALLGDGWYRGRLGFHGGKRNIYGDRLGFLAQLELYDADGVITRVVTDEGWRAATGPILASDLYDGETYDACLERPGWSEPDFGAHDWLGVRPLEHDLRTLFAPLGPPVRRTQTLAPVSITRSPSGKTLLDFGQNLVGRLRLRVQGEAGQTVTLRHAEVLEAGELGTRPLRGAKATDRYTLRGGDPETWEPRFTFHGFRYAEVTGWPGDLREGDVEAVVLHSDLERRGFFACSNPRLERLHENVVWSMRGNFLDLPTDCPQRDERLGWTGDIQVFAPTAAFLYDVSGFLSSWLADLAAEQDDAGVVPFIVPNVVAEGHTPAAAWGDAAVIVPWVLYERYGDAGVLAAQFDSMKGWVEHLRSLAGPSLLWAGGFQYGDWLDPDAPPENASKAKTDPDIVATAYFAHSAELLGRAAGVLEQQEDAARYRALAEEIRRAFRSEYATPSGRLMSDAPTAYALALTFGLLEDPEQRRHAGARLAELVRRSDYRISTGFVGTPLICDALLSAGAEAEVFRLLTETGCPSWLYPVTQGATTIWERWDSMLPDGSINPGEMTSFNHYALGAVADFLQRRVAGLAPGAPGYRRLEVEPHIGGGLTHASARYRTLYGLAEVAWALSQGQLELNVLVPPNTTARVVLPGTGAVHEVGSGRYRWVVPHAQDSGA